jgi:DNA-binding NarL/FixJ family response regulator
MKTTILLADDHAMFRDGLKLLLETGTEIQIVGQAADGVEAIDLVKTLRPHVVLMDITMPGLDGIAAADRIKSIYPGTKVVVLSMHATAEHIYRAFKAGADGYLLKDAAGTEVIRAVRTVQAGKRYLCDSISAVMIEHYIRERERTADDSPLRLLSPRELEVLKMVAEGTDGVKIAQILHLSRSTVETYRHRAMQKLNLSDMAGLVKFAIQHGLTSL